MFKFSGKIKDLKSLLYLYTRMVDKGEIEDKFSVLAKIENNEVFTRHFGKESLLEIQ